MNKGLYDSSIQAYYPLIETTGETAYDYSGNENHGTVNGAGPAGTGTVAGPLGQTAYDFDGSNDNVELENSSSLNVDTFSVIAWVNYANTNESSEKIYDKSDTTTNKGYGLFKSDTSGGVGVYFYDGSTDYFTSGGNIDNGDWHLITGTYDKSDLRLYIDGTEVSSSSQTQTISNTSSVAKIGMNAQNTNRPFLGKISGVRVHNRALTPQEISYLYEVSQRGQYVSSVKSL